MKPDKIYVLSCTKNGKDVFSTTDYDAMRKFFADEDKVVVGHNICRFDIPVLERILKIKIKCHVVDTLALSWCLFPTRTKHGLEEWGLDFNIPKPKIDNWDTLSIEEYTHRCEEDVKINFQVWRMCWTMLSHLYDRKEDDIWRYTDYISSKMYQARLQEESKWKLDKDFVVENLKDMLAEQAKKVDALKAVMPKVPIKKVKTKPKRFLRKDGTHTASALSWLEQLEQYKLSQDTQEIEYIDGYEEPNPNSTDQLKNWLYSLGWVPETYKEVKDKKTGDIREVPQINKEKQKGGGVCDSIKKLYDKEPNLELLDGLSILNHRISILNGFLRDVDADDCVTARISGFTNTLRVKHTEIVNLPKVNIPYGAALRGALIAPEGHELCGADKASLEDRIKQHYLYPLDPEYVLSMSEDDWDPHLDIANVAGRVTKEQVEYYKWFSSLSDEDKVKHDKEIRKAELKAIKLVRDIMKNVNYACQYGAGPPRISKTGGISLKEARELHKIYWQRNWAIKEVAAQQEVKMVNKLMWIYNPVSGFWYYLKYDKDRFSTLVQGTASYCFDTWVGFILEKRPQLTATFHDEGVWTIKKGFRKECTELMHEALEKTNEKLNLNRRLDISVQFGDRYSQIH